MIGGSNKGQHAQSVNITTFSDCSLVQFCYLFLIHNDSDRWSVLYQCIVCPVPFLSTYYHCTRSKLFKQVLTQLTNDKYITYIYTDSYIHITHSHKFTNYSFYSPTYHYYLLQTTQIQQWRIRAETRSLIAVCSLHMYADKYVNYLS